MRFDRYDGYYLTAEPVGVCSCHACTCPGCARCDGPDNAGPDYPLGEDEGAPAPSVEDEGAPAPLVFDKPEYDYQPREGDR